MLSRRLFAPIVVLAAFAVGAVPVSAKSQIIAQITSPKNHPGIYVSRGLIPSHRYQIQIVVPTKKVKYSGVASETFTYVLNRRLGTYTTVVKLNGIGSRSFALAVPKVLHKARVDAWMLAAQVASPTRHTTLKLRLIQH